MTEYIYRVVYRTKEEHWPWTKDPAENVWRIYGSYGAGDRPYTKAGSAKSRATQANNRNIKLEFKVQRLPADNWEFI